MSEARKIELEEEQNDELQPVVVLDDASAEMILRQLKDAEDQYERMSAWYKVQTQRLKEVRDRTREWAETCLRPYMEMAVEAGLATGKKIRSFEMPGGTLKLAKQDPEYETKDDELVPWLEANKLDEFVAVKKEARWGEFKKTLPKNKAGELQMVIAEDGTANLLSEDGEVIPGIKAIFREDKFSIKCK